MAPIAVPPLSASISGATSDFGGGCLTDLMTH